MMNTKQRWALVSLIVTIIAGLFSALSMAGTTVSLPQVLGLYAFGFGGGASLTALIMDRKSKK